MSEYITLKKDDPLLKRHLLGEVPNNPKQQSLPVYVDQKRIGHQAYTFQMVNKNDISRPNWLRIFYLLTRFDWVGLTVIPVIVTYCYLIYIGFPFEPVLAGVLLLCAMASHSSVFIFNDYHDHMRFVEHIRTKGGTQVIKMGWMTARSVRNSGLISLGISIFSGALLAYWTEWRILFLGVIGIGAGFLYSFLSRHKRFLGLDLVAITIFLGPYLVYSLSWGVFSYFNFGLGLVGLFFGLLAYICIGYRYLENLIFYQSKSGGSVFERLGFDKSKKMLMLILFFIPPLYVTSIVNLNMNLVKSPLFWVVFLIPFASYIYLYWNAYRLNTSLGSTIITTRIALNLFHLTSGLAIIGYLIFGSILPHI